jgi:hypothetical protein
MEIIKKTNKQILNAKATSIALDMAKSAKDSKFAKYEKALDKAKVLRDAILSKYHAKALNQAKRES